MNNFFKTYNGIVLQNVLYVIVAVVVLVLSSCQKKERVINFPYTDISKANLIPLPLEINPTHTGFPLDIYTTIAVDTSNKDLQKVGRFLVDKIKSKIGITIPMAPNDSSETVISIAISNQFGEKNSEAYALEVLQDSVILTSNTAEGAFRAVQTLRQLIPEVANDTLAETKIWVIPTGHVLDAPQFKYRGTMLDVSRHFFEVEAVKKYIDVLSYYKINVLHLHLSDDQGWRIAINSWPKLTEIGGSTQVGGGPGGFFTQKDYLEIIDYAAAHHITVVPEIDMPGHTNAASVSYPFLNGNGKTPKLYTGQRVGFSTFDTRKDTVYSFIDDVVREISALSPGPYFHIGGDESHVTKKKDYIYFVNKVEKIVQKHGKRMIGWDEVANTNIDSTSISQIWRSEDNMKTALGKGMKIILSPADKAYLDMKYDSLSKFGLRWAGYIPVDVAYNWNPETLAPKASILGIEAPLWSETISTIQELEYLAFPRIIGYAELSWTVQEKRSWEDYKTRLAGQVPYLNRMQVNFYPSPLIEWPSTEE